MVATFAMMGCQNLAVPPEVMQHIVHVESGANPYAIGVVDGQLVRQPQNLDEALATVQMLLDRGYNFSVGLGQINRYNLAKYGLTSYAQAFQACPNLVASSNIVADCYDRAGGNWGHAFSCYYAGDFVRGYRDGYVQKIYESMGQSAPQISAFTTEVVKPILRSATSNHARADYPGVGGLPADSSAYRIAIRSSAIDTAVSAGVAAATSTSTMAMTTTGDTTAASSLMATPDQRASAANDRSGIFVPKVSGPNDSQPSAVGAATKKSDSASPTQGGHDAAFVF